MSATATARLGLIRHGVTDWNREHRLQGRADRPLDAAGRAEIGARRLPPSWSEARVVASPLKRARETATLLTSADDSAGSREGAAAVEIDPRLIEMDFGAWEGARGADLAADATAGHRDVEAWGWSFAPPGGESVGDVRDRVLAFLRDAATRGGATVAVCHIGVMRVMLALAHGWAFEGPAPFRVKRLRLYPLALDADGAPRPDGEAAPLPPRDRPIALETS